MTVMADGEIDAGARVGVAAEALGLSVRTLHHWDEIGLVSPSRRTSAGYRLYTPEDLERLRRVVAYREAGLGLEAIRDVLDDAATEIGDTLREQRAQLTRRIRQTFGDQWEPQRAQLARFAWGGSRQWAQFAERSASRSPAQWRALSGAVQTLERDLADAMGRTVVPGSEEADELVDRHRELFSQFFPLTRSMQVCLARMFEADPGFSSYYDGISAGLAMWLRQIIDASARGHGIDPDSATWE